MLTIKGTNKINDPYDSVVTYITLRLSVFSKALSGISLISFPPRSLKKKQYNLHLFYLFNLLTMKHLKIMALRRLNTAEGVGRNLNLTQFHTGGSNPWFNPLTFYIPFLT